MIYFIFFCAIFYGYLIDNRSFNTRIDAYLARFIHNSFIIHDTLTSTSTYRMSRNSEAISFEMFPQSYMRRWVCSRFNYTMMNIVSMFLLTVYFHSCILFRWFLSLQMVRTLWREADSFSSHVWALLVRIA